MCSDQVAPPPKAPSRVSPSPLPLPSTCPHHLTLVPHRCLLMSPCEEAVAVVQDLASSQPAGVDFKICALVSAATHYRRATVVNPFPSELFGATAADRDFEALRHCLDALPSVASLADRQSLSRLSTQQLLLLHWLLAHPKRPAASITKVSIEDVRQSLPSMRGWLNDISHNPSLRPQSILQLQRPSPDDVKGAGQVLAFHGTHMENVHSIIHLGLLNLSGTKLMRTGAVFGEGIYFSTELTVAFAFANAGPTWRFSSLGGRQHCLLMCGIDKARARLDGDSQAPDKYLVVDRSDAVTIYYAFMYGEDDAGLQAAAAATHPAAAGPAAAAAAGAAGQAQAAGRAALLPVLVGCYLLWLLYVGLRDNWPLVRRLFRRYLGIKLA